MLSFHLLFASLVAGSKFVVTLKGLGSEINTTVIAGAATLREDGKFLFLYFFFLYFTKNLFRSTNFFFFFFFFLIKIFLVLFFFFFFFSHSL